MIGDRGRFGCSAWACVGDARLGAFHDAVLELGSVPLPGVTARIDRFISEGGKGPYPDME
jgi:hypothetical protein